MLEDREKALSVITKGKGGGGGVKPPNKYWQNIQINVYLYTRDYIIN